MLHHLSIPVTNLERSAAFHIAFAADSHAAVDAFHAAALRHGGTDDGKPGLRHYAPRYYAAFVRDPDGYRLEAVINPRG